jgi:hypothetical protein
MTLRDDSRLGSMGASAVCMAGRVATGLRAATRRTPPRTAARCASALRTAAPSRASLASADVAPG